MDLTSFDSGTPVCPLIREVYLAQAETLRGRWGEPARTAGDSFCAWLNAPATCGGAAEPLVSNLAAFIYRSRADLREEYPELRGRARIGFLRWFLDHARKEYGFDEAFRRPVYESFLRWATAPAAEEGDPQPRLSNLAVYVYETRPDLRAEIPDLRGRPRVEFSRWFLVHVPREWGIGEEFVRPVYESLVAWGAGPCDERGRAAHPMLSNMAVHLYESFPQLRERFPSLEGSDRIEYIRWFLANARRDYGLDEAFTRPMRESFTRWAVAPSPDDPDGSAATPVVTNLGAHLHRVRSDLASELPDLYGVHRVDFSVWFTHFARAEHGVEREQILPVIVSWASGGGQAPNAPERAQA
jgi:hypothetical protein